MLKILFLIMILSVRGDAIRVPNLAVQSPLLRQCLTELALTYAEAEENVIIIVRVFELMDVQITEFPVPAYYIVADYLPMHRIYKRFKSDILLIITTLPIPSVLAKIQYTHKSRFILIPRNNKEELLLFRDFWDARILNIISLSPQKDSVLINTIFPHNPKSCEKIRNLTTVGFWNETHKEISNLFPNKIQNLHGCTLKATLLERPPSVYKTSTGEIAGIEIEIIKALAYSINATVEFKFLHDKQWTKNYKSAQFNILMMDLTGRHSDLVAGSLMFTASVSSYSEGIDYSLMYCITFAVPKNFKTHGYFGTLNFFTKHMLTRINLVTCGILIVVCWRFFKIEKVRKPLSKAVLLVLHPLIGCYLNVPKSFKFRIIMLGWLWNCFLFWKVFEVYVSSRAIVPQRALQLETIEDVLNTETTITGESFFLAETLAAYYNSKRKAKLLKIGYNVNDALDMAVRYKNVSYLGTKENLLHALSQSMELSENIHIQDACSTSYPPVIQTAKNSPYYEEFKKRIQSLVEFGIISKLHGNSMNTIVKKIQRKHMENAKVSMSMADVSGPILIYVVGITIAAMVLVFEKLSTFLSKISIN